MAGPWVTFSELRRALADSLKQDETAFDGSWEKIIERSNVSAANDITAALVGRGFTAAQIDTWGRRVEFNLDLGVFWCLVRGAGVGTYSDAIIKMLDRRKELADVAITDETGNPLSPNSGVDPDDDIYGGGAVSGGQMNDCHWRVKKTTSF